MSIGHKPHRLSASTVAWVLGLIAIAVLGQFLIFTVSSGTWALNDLSYIASIVFAAVGALVASRQPRNHLGWLLLFSPLPAGIGAVLSEYGYLAEVNHFAGPFLTAALWLGAWAWIPSFGLAFSVITVRFPDGRVPHGWRFVDLLALAGTAIFAMVLATSPFRPYSGLLDDNPVALPWTGGQFGALLTVGIGFIAVSALSAVASMAIRYKHANADLRQQLKWVLLANGIVALTFVYGGLMEVLFRTGLQAGLIAFAIVLVIIPLAIGVAILRHQLFDIDLIINRTLVYVSVSAILGGLFFAVVELLQKLFLAYTSEKSEMTIVVSAFVVAAAFTPVQKWVESTVEQRLGGGRDAAVRLHNVSASAESVVRVIDPHRFAHWLLDESVTAFEANGGEMYLYTHHPTQPFHSRGTMSAEPGFEVAVRHEDHDLGRFLLGRRRGGIDYSRRDREALRRSAAALGEALAVATDLGHLTHPALPVTPAPFNGDGAVAPATNRSSAV